MNWAFWTQVTASGLVVGAQLVFLWVSGGELRATRVRAAQALGDSRRAEVAAYNARRAADAALATLHMIESHQCACTVDDIDPEGEAGS